MGGRITTALGTPTGTDGILGAIRRGEVLLQETFVQIYLALQEKLEQVL